MGAGLEFCRGPLFAACFLVMVLGLTRLLLLRVWELNWLWRRASLDHFPVGRAFRNIAMVLSPVTRLHRVRWLIGLPSSAFHIGAILVAIFLADHVWLWKRTLGISWYTLPAGVADALTVVTILAIIGLLAIRMFDAATRFMSGPADYLLLVLLLVLFASGFLGSHLTWSIFTYETTMFVHVLAGNMVLALMPFTKLSHAVLFPFERISSEVYWRFPAGAGDRVAAALHGKEPAAP
jgi:nitrate reductase gamma subunit